MGQAQAAPPKKEPEFHTDLPVGEVLRRARLHYGQSLKDVEKNIRIRSSQIEAIESGNYENLPGRVYAIGFVRSYAEYLGLDGAQVVSLFKAQSTGTNVKPEFHFPAPASESKLPSKWVLIGSVAATILLVMFWWSTNDSRRDILTTVPAVPEELKEKAGIQDLMAGFSEEEGDVAPDAAETTEGQTAITESQDAPVQGPPVAGSVVAVGPPASASGASSETTAPAQGEDAKAAPQPAASAQTAAKADEENGITLNIVENSWVEIRDQSGKTIVSKVLKVGDQYFVPNRPDLQMSLGNAGGVEVVIDGKTMPPLGARGDVRRDIPLDADVMRAQGTEPQSGSPVALPQQQQTPATPPPAEPALENPAQ